MRHSRVIGIDRRDLLHRREHYTDSDDSWYTVNGVKLDGVPNRKGLYLHGGRKVVISGR